MSFRNRLVLFLVVTLITVQGLTAFVLYNLARDQLTLQGKQELSAAASLFKRELNSLSGRVTDAVRVLALDYPFRQAIAQHDRATALSVLRNHGGRVGASRMILVDLDGTISADTAASARVHAAFPFAALLGEARVTGHAAALAALEGHVCWMVVVPVLAPVPIGYVAACVPIDNAFLDDLRRLSAFPMSIALATPGAGRAWMPAARSGDRLREPNLPHTELPVEERIATIMSGGEDYLTLTTRLETAAASAPVIAVFDYPLKEVLRPYRSIVSPMILIFGASLALALLGAMLIVHGVSRPLEELAATARRIAGGDYAPPPKLSLKNEVGQLADALTVMAEAVSQREAALTSAMREIEAARDEAVQANRLKSEFLANISHELRTPLNAIIGFGEVFQIELLGPLGASGYRDYADHIVESGRHLLFLVEEMLDLAKLETGRLELDYAETAMGALVMRVVRRLEQADGGPKVTMTLDGDPSTWPIITADARKLTQVFAGLIGNALKFTAAGGSVTISCAATEMEVRFRIADTGIGIRTEDLPLVVKPFYRVSTAYNAKYQGVGLGLPVAKAIVELHGGALTIDSTLGIGTTVFVILPRRHTAARFTTAAA